MSSESLTSDIPTASLNVELSGKSDLAATASKGEDCNEGIESSVSVSTLRPYFVETILPIIYNLGQQGRKRAV